MGDFKAPCGGILLDEDSFEVEDKVIKVKSGGGGGGDNTFVITLTGTPPSQSSGALGNPAIDKTFSEIKSAISAGKNLICKYHFAADGLEIYAQADLQIAILGVVEGMDIGSIIFESIRIHPQASTTYKTLFVQIVSVGSELQLITHLDFLGLM